MNEIPSVATNGSWVRMMVKINAGRSGARRPQSLRRRAVSCAVVAPRAALPRRPVPTATLIGPLLSSLTCLPGHGGRRPSAEPRLIALGDVRRELLALIEGVLH